MQHRTPTLSKAALSAMNALHWLHATGYDTAEMEIEFYLWFNTVNWNANSNR